MDKQKTKSTSSEETRIIHLKALNASAADVKDATEILRGLVDKFPFPVQFIITSGNFEFQSVDTLLEQLYLLKKDLDKKDELEGNDEESI